MNENKFIDNLKKNGISLNTHQIDQFQQYFKLLELWNKKLNLTAIINEEEVYEKHFFDSLTLAFKQELNNKTLLDIGTGAGFPAIPLKIVFPSLKIVAIDATAKKINFVNEVIKVLDLKDIKTIVVRVEDYAKNNRELFDIVVARAISRLNVLMELATPLVSLNGVFVAYKGAQADEELKEASNACKILNLELVENQSVILPTSHAKRYNLIYRKLYLTPLEYPRNYNIIKKRPL